MSKVYIVNKLNSSYGHHTIKIFGIFSNKDNANKFAELEEDNYIGDYNDIDVDEFELDDIDLLNRIAKESEIEK